MEELKELEKEEARLTDNPPQAASVLDTAKRQQLMDGARRAFLEHGFDGASVGDIVRAAGISKGTLYAYYPSKEKLFEALVTEDRRKQAEAICTIDQADDDVERVLRKLGRNLMTMLVRPENIAFARIVIGAVGKFPEIGRILYEEGPQHAITKLSVYLRRMTAKGTLDIADADTELAACHFLVLCKSDIHLKVMFGVSPQPPSQKDIEHSVEAALTVFLKAYGAQGR